MTFGQFVIFNILLVACEPETCHESYGLDNVVALEIATEDMATMSHGTYAKSRVPVSLEINGELRQGTIAVAGATSVDDYKKSYEIHLKSPYLGKTVFRLNAMSRDPSGMHALIAYHIFNLSGVNTPFLEPIAVWINDQYAGLYLFQEKYDESYFAAQQQVPAALYQAENSVATMDFDNNFDVAFSVKIGNHEMVDLKRMLNTVLTYEKNGDRNQLQQQVDVASFINYMAVASYIHHWDGVDNNFFLLRMQGASQFMILPWDLDYTFVATHGLNDTTIFERNTLMHSLLENDASFGAAYRNRLRDLAEVASASELGTFAENLYFLIAEAYAADPILGRGDMSLDDHLGALKEHFAQMEGKVISETPDVIEVE